MKRTLHTVEVVTPEDSAQLALPDEVVVSQSKSAVSRAFVERTRTALGELLARRLDELELAALMIDGNELDEVCHVVALGISRDGTKVPLGLWQGSTENATALLADLQERGLRLEAEILCVLDGAKALRKAVRQVLGERTPVQRRIRHKERNVLGHLPDRERPWMRAKLRQVWSETNHERALQALRALAAGLDKSSPSAAASLREGMEERLTVTRLDVTGALKRTLESTNPVESMIELVRSTQRNVKRWRDGDMRQRWTAAGMLEAERHFRRVKGQRELAKLTAAIHRELHPTEEAATVQAA